MLQSLNSDFLYARASMVAICSLVIFTSGANVVAEVPVDANKKRMYLSVQGNTNTYAFYYGYKESEMIPCAENVDAAVLSCSLNEGFTGTYIGMYATANGKECDNVADFDWFNYVGK